MDAVHLRVVSRSSSRPCLIRGPCPEQLDVRLLVICSCEMKIMLRAEMKLLSMLLALCLHVDEVSFRV